MSYKKGHVPWMKDRHHSGKTKRSLSIAIVNLGSNHHMRSEVARDGMIGNTRGSENKGKNHSEEAKRKMSVAQLGEANNNWKGGIACEPYCDAWLDEGYKESIRERDNYTCQNPNCRKNCDHLPLTIHHIDYIKKNCHPWHWITLCASCNSRANFNRKHWVKFYQEIMAERHGYDYEQ